MTPLLKLSERLRGSRALIAWIAAAMLLVLAVAATLGYRTHKLGRGSDDPWTLLNESLGSDRPFEPLIAEMAYRPFRPLRSGAARPTPTPDLRLAAALLEKRLDGSMEQARRTAAARLLLDDTDGAVALLEQTVASHPSYGGLLADLSAAYLVRLDRNGFYEDAARALDASERAVVSSDVPPHAWFNLALARERLHLTRDAGRAWDRVAGSDGAIGKEAQARRAALAESTRESRFAQIAASLDSDARVPQGDSPAQDADADLKAEYLERRVLDSWAAAVEAGDETRADAIGARARALAAGLERVTHDRFPGMLVAALVDSPAASRTTVARGWRRHVAALHAWEQNDLPTARAANADANRAFQSAVPAIQAARIGLVTNLDRLDGRRGSALARLRETLRDCERLDFFATCGRVHWQLGLFAGEAADVGQSLAEYRRALNDFTRARDRESLGVVNALAAEEYLELDDFDSAWRHEAEALAALGVSRRIRRDPILTTAAMLSTAAQFHAAALSFRHPLIEDMAQAGSHVSLAFLYTDDALNLQKLGRTAEGLQRLDAAKLATSKMDDPGTAQLARALQDSTEAALVAKDSPRRADGLIAEAIAIYHGRDNDFAVPALQLERGRILVASGRPDEAAAAFTNGVAVVDRIRPGLVSARDRSALTSARWDLYAELADLRIRDHDDATAAELLDRARAANLDERSQRADSSRPPTSQPGVATIAFAVLPSGIHGWLVKGSERQHFVLAVSAAELAAMVAAYRTAVLARRPDGDLRRMSQRLFEAVLGPVTGNLADTVRLICVLDGPLFDLPMTSLIDPSTDRFLIERMSIVISPASSGFASRPVAHRETTRALVVGGTDRSSATADRLPPLAASRREATAIAALYPGASLAVDLDATREYFVARAESSTVVHFAGHAVVNERHPELSRLLFTPSSDAASSALMVSEIGEMHLSGVQLMVLSACDTARGRIAPGVGIVGLARAFLTRGVPSIVATLWPVDDENAAALFTSFHRSWAGGADSADALRAAQLGAIRNRFGIADWAGAIVVGQPVYR